ncbi:MAG: TatD family hydrolase [Ignavibacteria bacterium]
MFVDTHAHLFYPNFKGEVSEVIARARDAGVDYIIVPGTDLASSAQAVELADKYDIVYASVGIHPHDTKEWTDSLPDNIEQLAVHNKVVAIGETGLDYYYDFSPRDAQKKAFTAQIELALKLNLPVIIHNREADEDIMKIIRSYKDTCLKAQFHCYSGSLADAMEFLAMNHFLSFTGNITFQKADNLRQVLRNLQVENLLLETDSPFLTPVPRRGQRNEPAYIRLVAEKIAEIQGISVENVAALTSSNAFRFFGIGLKSELTFTYETGGSLYVNVTNRCNADCVFCDRKGDAVIKGYNLKMSKTEEPPASVYIKEIGDPKRYKEIVFCGYGEPAVRWDVVKEISRYVKDSGGITRMNTNGHGSFINKRDITPELKGLIDSVSISLNSVNPEVYGKLMRVPPKMHAEMLDFARKAKNYTNVVMTVVGLSSIDTEEARLFVENEIGVSYRTRPYF